MPKFGNRIHCVEKAILYCQSISESLASLVLTHQQSTAAVSQPAKSVYILAFLDNKIQGYNSQLKAED